MDTLDWQNGFEALLDDRTVLADTYIKMTPVPSTTKGRLVIEDNSSTNYEIIHFTSKDASGVYTTAGGARNEDGNSTGIHARGARVRMNITAQDMKEIRDYADTVISAYSAMPAGAITPFAGSTAPASYLLCDGAAVSRTTYATLFAVTGTSYGNGNGTTTFNLPNLKGSIPVGRDAAQVEFDTLGKTGGAKTHTLTIAEMPSHNHMTTTPLQTSDTDRGSVSSAWSIDNSYDNYSSFTGGGGAHNNLQPYQVLNYIIKT